ncbi:MAG: class I SAM-dependent methyltransferase [Thermodesulfobacteriota bacterium]
MKEEGSLKAQVRDFWDAKSCGEGYAIGEQETDYYESHRRSRYGLEPYLHDFAKFQEGAGKDVLEIGVGMGADHIEWAKSGPRSLTGIDRSQRAIEHTRRRLALYGFKSDVRVGDAEALPFGEGSFDLVYFWGVLHHTPDTQRQWMRCFVYCVPAARHA